MDLDDGEGYISLNGKNFVNVKEKKDCNLCIKAFTRIKMDEIVLKWVTVLSGILTVIVCVSVFFFPDIHERAVLAAEQQKEVGGGNLIATTANPKAVVEQSKDLNAQLKIALPEDFKSRCRN